ncbi:MAG: LacI family DNA-binding transcriptional regulator [bacterium]|nr:LacI family DNA-binding transcriptional regulator [bacterium]
MKRVCLKDIAEEVNVSQTAVSKVLNGLPIRIGQEKREKIIETAQRLGYSPNMIARGLRNQKTKSIGIVIPDMSTLFYPELLRSLEIKLSSYGYQTLICNSEDDPVNEREHIETLLSRSVDGLVVAPAAGRDNIDYFKEIQESRKTFVLIDRYFAGEGLNFIVTDNKQGAGAGVGILADQGVARIIYLGNRVRNQPIDDRLTGVREEAARRSIGFTTEQIFLTETDRESAGATCRRILGGNLKDTGIFLESNRLLMGLLDAAREKGLQIPDDFHVIGFDPFIAEMAYPADYASLRVIRQPFSLIRQDIAGMVQAVGEYLVSSLNKQSNRLLQRMLPAEIIPGNYGQDA